MHFRAVLNEEGGTLRTTDLDALSSRMRETLNAAGHELEIEVTKGSKVVDTLAKAASARSVDVVLAGGGDGTISAAAAALMGKRKALAVLPAGTMNLFARSLGVPLALDEAVSAFADGEMRNVDIATANGRPFVHQFSIGFHAKMVKLRSKMEYASRLGKIRASAKAAYSTFMNPPSMDVRLTIGDAELETRTTGIGITNNLFGEGHLPYADRPDGGVLGVYVTVAEQRGELARFVLNMARGRWRDNEQVEIHQAGKVTLELLSRRKKRDCVIDGELCAMERKTVVEIHPGALRVLAPRSQVEAEAA
ncbi:MAG: diacylglycerol kinase family lipid kinase [Rhizobiaceae bacterium]|nr:diacylglycerol kinase family lipid kinase [Rhizobiaceae bacterium]